MNLKSLLKSVKLNESTISMILGAIVIVVIGVMIVNFFGNNEEGQSIPPIETEDQVTLPTTYTVAEGDDLWKISEQFYQTGYNWTDIAEANDITNPNQIAAGQEIVIPNVAPRGLDEQTPTPTTEVVAMEEEKMEAENGMMEETQEVTATPSPKPTETPQMTEEVDQPIQGASYTVVHGDTLWDIAVRAYGDGYRWVDIAKANELVNPNIIHTGNVFTLPR